MTSTESPDFKRLFDRSSLVDKKLKTALRKNIRRAGADATAAVRAKVGSSGGLRGSIGAGVKLKVMTGARAGVTIVASSSAMKPGQESLVRAWESQKGWRHPVFGGQTWVVQKGHPYFQTTITEHRPAIRAAVEKAMEEALASLKK